MRSDVDIKSLDPDNLSRFKIVNYVPSLTNKDASYQDFKKNFFVEASAGSGKTYSLTQRLVSMIENGIDVRNITTITFTKAAANEFFERFQKLLSERCNQSDESKPLRDTDLPYTTKESRQLCAKALENIDLCFMGTIDSFCNTLAKEHPVELGIPATSEVVSDEDLTFNLNKVYSDILNGKYGKVLLDKTLEFNKTVSNGKDTFVEGIKFVMEHRDSNILLSSPSGISIDTYFKEEEALLNDIINKVNISSAYLKDGVSVNKAVTLIKENKAKINLSWSNKTKEVINIIKSLLNLRFTSIPTEFDIEDYLEVEKKTIKIKEDILSNLMIKINNYIASLSMDLFKEVAKEIEKEFKHEGVLTFFDYLFHLRNVLKEDAKNGGKLAKIIYEHHKYYLIDESQDTNPLQTELMFYLTARTPNEVWDKCEPKDGSLFIVGDPKQSIYRFRGADVSAYQYTKSLFEKGNFGEVLYMSRNYRSSKLLREWFNKTMPKMLNPVDGVEKCEHKIIPTDDDKDKEEIEKQVSSNIYRYVTSSKGNSVSKDDSIKVTSIIQNIVFNPKFKLYDKKLKLARPVEYKDIMVITATTTMGEYIARFLENQIPFSAEGRTLFEKSLSLTVLKKFLKAFFNPCSKNDLIELLTSEYCNFEVIDLEKLRENNYSFLLGEEIKTGVDKIDNKIAELNNIYSKVKNMSISGMLLYFMNNLEIFEFFGVDFLECVYYALSILEDLVSKGEIQTSSDLEKCLEKINSNNKDYERCLSFGKNTNSVKIANVHKVKGLQAPVVILAQPQKREPKSNYLTLRKDGKTNTYLFNLSKKSDSFIDINLISTTEHDELKDLANAYSHAEKLRIEYVAATRAENILLIGEAESSSGAKTSNVWDDLISCGGNIEEWNFDEENPVSIKEEKNIISNLTKGVGEVNIDSSNKKSYQIVRPSTVKIAKANAISDKEVDEVRLNELPTGDESKISATLKGTLIHRAMELMVSSKNKFSLDKIIEILRIEYERISDYEESLKKVINIIQNGGFKQSDGGEADILKEISTADHVMCETPFAFKEDSKIINGYIDLIYHKDNVWYIVDYKTNAEGDINKLTLEYKGQLETYEKAFFKITGEKAVSRIYHIDA